MQKMLTHYERNDTMTSITKRLLATLCAISALGMSGCASKEVTPSGGNAAAAPKAEDTASVLAEAEVSSVIAGTGSINIRYSSTDSDRSYITSERFVLERQTGEGSWTVVPFADNVAFDALAYTISADAPSLVFSVPLDSTAYKEPLPAGRYRVTREVTEYSEVPSATQDISAEFEIFEEGQSVATEIPVTVTVDGGDTVSLGTDSIMLSLTYTGDSGEYSYGSSYSLERFDENSSEWVHIPFAEDVFFYLLAHIVSPESPHNTLTVSLSDSTYAQPLTAGRYRVGIGVTTPRDLFCEFVLTDAEPPAEDPETQETTETEYIPLTDTDVIMEIAHDGDITTDTEAFTLNFTYVGTNTEHEYMFGCDYMLQRLDDNGEWNDVRFAENAAFVSLGYTISSSYPENSITVSLRDASYAEPLEAGTYRVVKHICDGVTLMQAFEIKEIDAENELVIEMESGALKFIINEVQPDKYICSLTHPYPAVYEIACDTSEYSFSTGDTIEVEFAPMYKNDEYSFTVIPVSIISSSSTTSSEITVEPVPLIDSESGSLTLTINEITDEGFVCSLAWPYPDVYTVVCDPTDYGDFCIGDNIEVEYAPMYMLGEYEYRVIPVNITISDFQLEPGVDYKPVIYLYPEDVTEVSVKLDYNGSLILTDPVYGDGWNVTAYPDGKLITADGNEYPYLFWEGRKAYTLDTDKGFCIKGTDSESFLKEKLAYLGLSDSEAADLLEFWLPHLESSPYNIIRFHAEDYTDNAILDISPCPDTVIRVYMSITPCDVFTSIAPQQLEAAAERNGFTVVEWGGCIIP